MYQALIEITTGIPVTAAVIIFGCMLYTGYAAIIEDQTKG